MDLHTDKPTSQKEAGERPPYCHIHNTIAEVKATAKIFFVVGRKLDGEKKQCL